MEPQITSIQPDRCWLFERSRNKCYPDVYFIIAGISFKVKHKPMIAFQLFKPEGA
jgi:hypothetical protein